MPDDGAQAQAQVQVQVAWGGSEAAEDEDDEHRGRLQLLRGMLVEESLCLTQIRLK